MLGKCRLRESPILIAMISNKSVSHRIGEQLGITQRPSFAGEQYPIGRIICLCMSQSLFLLSRLRDVVGTPPSIVNHLARRRSWREVRWVSHGGNLLSHVLSPLAMGLVWARFRAGFSMGRIRPGYHGQHILVSLNREPLESSRQLNQPDDSQSCNLSPSLAPSRNMLSTLNPNGHQAGFQRFCRISGCRDSHISHLGGHGHVFDRRILHRYQGVLSTIAVLFSRLNNFLTNVHEFLFRMG